MTNKFQLETITKPLTKYILAIILSSKKKNCSAMSRDIGIPKKHLYAAYKYNEINTKQINSSLIKMVNKYSKKDLPSVLIIDPTIIRKWFAKDMENLAYDYDGIVGKSKQCLEPVVAAWTNTKITIPLDFIFWTNKSLTSIYRKKSELATELILKLKEFVHFNYAAMDGAFASEAMLQFCKKHVINFCMRIAKNRVIVSKNGIKAQLQNHPQLKFKKNERYKTIKGTYKGIECFFTAHKRYSNSGKSWNIVYIISSLNIPAKEQAKAYNIRWNIEKMFRTTKQCLGLGDCQCLENEKQRTHIFSVFFAYAKLEEQKLFKRKKSVEQILMNLRIQKTYVRNFQSCLLEQTIMH